MEIELIKCDWLNNPDALWLETNKAPGDSVFVPHMRRLLRRKVNYQVQLGFANALEMTCCKCFRHIDDHPFEQSLTDPNLQFRVCPDIVEVKYVSYYCNAHIYSDYPTVHEFFEGRKTQ